MFIGVPDRVMIGLVETHHALGVDNALGPTRRTGTEKNLRNRVRPGLVESAFDAVAGQGFQQFCKRDQRMAGQIAFGDYPRDFIEFDRCSTRSILRECW